MDINKIKKYKDELNEIKGRISILKAKLSELEELQLEKDDILDKCNHELVLVYGRDERKVGSVKLGYCLICDEPVDIIWEDYYLKRDKFDKESIIDVTDIKEDFDHENLDEEEISDIVCQRINEFERHAKVTFHECLNSGVTDREEIKKEIREEIVRLNSNGSKVKKLK